MSKEKRKHRTILTENDPCKTCGKILSIDNYRWINSYRRSECKSCESANSTLTNRIRKYKMSAADYNQRLKDQNNLCYICHDIERYHGTLCVDHNHKTGKIRKLLCNRCNRLLGLVGEDITVLTSLVNYIKEHEDAV